MQRSTEERGLLSALNGSLVVSECPHRDDDMWVLRDTDTDEEIPIWPSEVSEMVALLRAFESHVTHNQQEEEVDHNCRKWAVAHDVDGVEKTISQCAVCHFIFTPDSDDTA